MSTELASPILEPSAQQQRTLALWEQDSTQQKIRDLIPRTMDFDRFKRLTTSLLLRNPKIAECTPVSFFACLSDCATIGVYPDPVTGKAFIIPRWNSKLRITEATLLIGYKGMRDMALRSKDIADLWTGVVRKGDKLVLTRAPRMQLVHEQDPACNGEVVGFYSCCALTNGLTNYEWLSLSEVIETRDAVFAGIKEEDAWKREKSPWTTDFEEMGRKTAVRRHFKSLPLSSEVEDALSKIDEAEMGNMRRVEQIADTTAARPTVPVPARGAAAIAGATPELPPAASTSAAPETAPAPAGDNKSQAKGKRAPAAAKETPPAASSTPPASDPPAAPPAASTPPAAAPAAEKPAAPATPPPAAATPPPATPPPATTDPKILGPVVLTVVEWLKKPVNADYKEVLIVQTKLEKETIELVVHPNFFPAIGVDAKLRVTAAEKLTGSGRAYWWVTGCEVVAAGALDI